MKLSFETGKLRIRVSLEELTVLRRSESLNGQFSPAGEGAIGWSIALTDDAASWKVCDGLIQARLTRDCAERLAKTSARVAGRNELTEDCGISGAVLELDFFDVKEKSRSKDL